MATLLADQPELTPRAMFDAMVVDGLKDHLSGHASTDNVLFLDGPKDITTCVDFSRPNFVHLAIILAAGTHGRDFRHPQTENDWMTMATEIVNEAKPFLTAPAP